MDKIPNRNSKITIRINGEEKEYKKEDILIHHWQAKRETAAAKEAPETFRTVTPFKKRRKKAFFSKRTSFPNRKGRIPPFHIMAVASAIVIGLFIGYVLWQMMAEADNDPDSVPTTGNSFEKANGTERIVLPAVEFILLQQGVYKNENAVKELVSELKRKNIPAAYLEDEGQYRVVVAAAHHLETGKALAQTSFYQNSFTEIWPKQLSMKEKIIQNLTGDEKEFLQFSYSIYEMLVDEGTAAFLQEKYQADAELFTAAKEKIQSLQKIEEKQLQQLQSSLLNGLEQLEHYVDSKKEADWLQFQSHLLEFAVQYYQL